MAKRNKDNFTPVRNGRVVIITADRGAYSGDWKITHEDDAHKQYRVKNLDSGEVMEIYQAHTRVNVRSTVDAMVERREKAKQIGMHVRR
jgi:ribosomal protein L13